MKKQTPLTLNLLRTALIFFIASSSALANGRVIRQNGNYVALVNGTTVYSGSKYFDAINAAISGSGSNTTVTIETSGTSGNDNGSIYAIRPYPGQTLDFQGNTVDCTRDDLVIGIYVDRRNGITIKNIRMTGAPRYGIWFNGCSDVTISGANLQLSSSIAAGDGIRVDDRNGSTSPKNLKISGEVHISGTRLHGIETYGIDGVSIGNVTVNNTGGCGVLLNNSKNCTVGTVQGSKNDQHGGYATFRVANSNGKTTCAKVYSRDSGRGFFSVSGSKDCTVNSVDIKGANKEGIYIQDSQNTKVLAGSISDSGSGNVRIRNSPNSAVNATFTGGVLSRTADVEEIVTIEEPRFSVFPNPSPDGKIHLHFMNNKSTKTIYLNSISGQLISKTFTTNDNSYTMNLQKKGLYLIRVVDTSGEYIRKVFIK